MRIYWLLLAWTLGATSPAGAPAAYRPAAPRPAVDVRTFGAVGDGRTDCGPAIGRAIAYARVHAVPTVYFPAGTYLIRKAESPAGAIRLANGVSLRGAGRAVCTLQLAGGQHNPPALFYQAWRDEPAISNVRVRGFTFDGSLDQQRFDADYQFCHALSINNGHNIEVRDCTFTSFRGDGLLFGDTDEPTSDARITRNVRVHDNEFYNIYREGCMFCCTDSAAFYRNRVHGPGYLVGGVDIERHSANETVRRVAVYQNLFDFRQGFGPAERGRPLAKYRRAVTMGFFYAGYPHGVADGRSGGHRVYDNTVYQGQIDCYGHTDVVISHNTFTSFFEEVAGIAYLTPHAVLVADAGTTVGLTRVRVTRNVIRSQMRGHGVMLNHYSLAAVTDNDIANVRWAGIQLLNASADVLRNSIRDVGTPAAPAAGILVSGNCNDVLIARNTVRGSRSGPANPTSYAVELAGYNQSPLPPRIQYNKAVNVARGVVGEDARQREYALLLGNRRTEKKP